MGEKKTKDVRTRGPEPVSRSRAAAAMLRMAQSTSDPVLASKLIDLAAHLKEQAGELPVPFTEAPDLQPKEKE
ncbi:MAG TPA: hypothetical protein VJ255_00730 [Candidatus Acidoferrum sp.]|jgi:hypothetical protein|nr:hypothetical protein [Candidatus Acidoferrum sp.]HWX16488.1 hypothetical protein [Chthoniobacterales bacterium]